MSTIVVNILTILARVAMIAAVVFLATSLINWNRGFWSEHRKHELVSATGFVLGAVLFLAVGRIWYSQLFAMLLGAILFVGRLRVGDIGLFLQQRWQWIRANRKA